MQRGRKRRRGAPRRRAGVDDMVMLQQRLDEEIDRSTELALEAQEARDLRAKADAMRVENRRLVAKARKLGDENDVLTVGLHALTEALHAAQGADRETRRKVQEVADALDGTVGWDKLERPALIDKMRTALQGLDALNNGAAR